MFDQLLQLLLGNLPAILFILALLVFWKWKPEMVLAVIKWFAAIVTEPDANGGKASASRVIGLYVAWNIIQQSWIPDYNINAMLWDLFMVTLGYALLSKILNTMSPAILDFAKGYRDKMTSRVPKE